MWKALDSGKEKWESFLDQADTIFEKKKFISVSHMMSWIVFVVIMKNCLDILEVC